MQIKDKNPIINYNECDCDEDNTCGCSYPNNVSDFAHECSRDEQCGCIKFDPHMHQYYHDDSICFCDTKGDCDCEEE